jgi:hypothetical protein
MTAAFILISGFALCVLLARPRLHTPFPSSFADLVLMGIALFHVAPELLHALFDLSPGPYRDGIPTSVETQWAMIASAGMVLFGFGCLCGRGMLRAHTSPWSFAKAEATSEERWFFIIAAAIASSAAGAAIVGLAVGGFDTDNYLLGNAALAGLLPFVVTVSVMAVVRDRYALVVIPLAAFALTLIGSRSTLAWALISGIVLVRMLGGSVSTRKLIFGVAGLASLVFLIALTREQAGRVGVEAGFLERAEAIESTLSHGGNTEAIARTLENHFTHRVDGNGYALQVLHAQASRPPMGLEPLMNSLALAVPSAVWSQKTDRPMEDRNQEYSSIVYYNIPDTDYLPTWLGGAISMFGWPTSLLAAWGFGFAVSALGAAFSAIRPYHLPILAGIAAQLQYFEGNIESLILGTRSTVILAIASCGLWLVARLAASVWRI